MPIEPVVIDRAGILETRREPSREGPSLTAINEPAPSRPLSEPAIGEQTRPVEALAEEAKELEGKRAAFSSGERDADSEALRRQAAFDAARLEAETRLALTVERVELEPPAPRSRFEQVHPIIILGSLQIDVRA